MDELITNFNDADRIKQNIWELAMDVGGKRYDAILVCSVPKAM